MNFGWARGRRAKNAPAVSRPSVDRARLERFGDQVLILALAIGVTSFPILLHLISPILATTVCLLSAAWIALRFDRAVPMVLIVSLTCQTTFVAMASRYVQETPEIDAMKIYNFLTSVGVWFCLGCRFLADYRSTSSFTRKIILLTSVILPLAGVYFILGLAIDPRGSTIYMRNIGLPVLLFQSCYIVATRHKLPLPMMVSLILGVLVGCGYFELFFTNRWLDMTNGRDYWALATVPKIISAAAIKNAQETGRVITSVIDLMTSAFLNTSAFGDLGLTVMRLQGPNFHPIRFGYVLATLMTVSAVHRRFVLPMLAFPLLLIISAKGAIVLFIVSVAFCASARYYRGRAMVIGLYGLLALYSVAVFISGMRNGDYHVLGLLGSLHGFFANPLGLTLGQGGNLSSSFDTIDWSVYQHAGATDVAVESGIGVLLYQMGVAAIAVIAIYIWMSVTAWRLYRQLNAPALALSCVMIAVILANGIFQEEALFAPLALGLIMVFVGLTFGAVDRAESLGRQTTGFSAGPPRKVAGVSATL